MLFLHLRPIPRIDHLQFVCQAMHFLESCIHSKSYQPHHQPTTNTNIKQANNKHFKSVNLYTQYNSRISFPFIHLSLLSSSMHNQPKNEIRTSKYTSCRGERMRRVSRKDDSSLIVLFNNFRGEFPNSCRLNLDIIDSNPLRRINHIHNNRLCLLVLFLFRKP